MNFIFTLEAEVKFWILVIKDIGVRKSDIDFVWLTAGLIGVCNCLGWCGGISSSSAKESKIKFVVVPCCVCTFLSF